MMPCSWRISSKMAEVESVILSLIEKDVPEGRKALQDGHENLAKVATYCQQKYSEANNRYKGAPDKAKVREETREVLNETKQFATQSLASVAYQINTLAINMLNLLDQQTSQLQSMESQINYISQTVNIHKEKVARREIGVLATSKNTTRTHKIIAPSKQEKPERYSRKQIDYSILDDIGHGVKLAQTDNIQRRKSSKKAPSPAPSAQPASLRAKPGTRMGISTKPPPPPVPPPTAPTAPSVPADYDMTYDSIQTSAPAAPPPPPPSAGPVVNPNKVIVQPPVAPPPPPEMGGHSPPPPPPPPFPIGGTPPASVQERDTYEAVDDIISPPPPPPTEDFYSTPSSLALPLPPEDMQSPMQSPMPPPPPPMGEEYLEKVIALYDYAAARGDELSFTENTVIYVVKKNDDGWYEGVIEGTGESGLFPGNYVDPIP